MDIEVVHKTRGENLFEKTLATLVGIAAILAALLATLEMHSNQHWEESSIRAANLSVEIFGKIAATGPRDAAVFGSQQASHLTSLEAAVRWERSPNRELGLALALADERVAQRLLDVSKEIEDAPAAAAELDPIARDVLLSDNDDIGAIVDEQREQVRAADRYGSRISRALFSLSLLALAAILLGLGAVLGLRGSGVITLTAAVVAMLVAAGWGTTALFI